MIRIQRTCEPDELKLHSDTQAEQHKNSVQADLNKYKLGKQKLIFDRDIYASKAVKAALIVMQQEKCCFCESKVTHISHGDVEHFRPKAAWRSSKSSKLSRPGYFWLAYKWENLLFCCQVCNQREKRNHFPLENEVHRCIFPDVDVCKEVSLFIDPCNEDPAKHIGFRGDTPFPINNSRKGQATIEGLGLKRKALRLRRSALLEILKKTYQTAVGIIPCSPALQIEAEKILTKYSASDAEYSHAVRYAIQDGFKFV